MRRSWVAPFVGALALAGCRGDMAGEQRAEPGPTTVPSTSTPPMPSPTTATTATTAVTASTAPGITTAGRLPGGDPVAVVPRPGALRLVVPVDPPDVSAFVQPGEWYGGDAVALPDGDVLFSLRDTETDHCTSRLVQVNPTTGARTSFAAGERPRVSPDARSVAFARPVTVDDRPLGCAVDELVVRDLITGAGQVAAPSARGRATFTSTLEWSPDGGRILRTVETSGADASTPLVDDVRTRSRVTLAVAPELDSQLQALVGAEAAPCRVVPRAFVTDGRITANLDCSPAVGDGAPAVPAWWLVPADGVVRSFDDTATGAVAGDLGWRFARPAPHLEPARRPSPDVTPWLRDDEWVADVAVLPGGVHLVAVRDRARYFDICTSRLVELDPVANTRREVGAGGSPSVSPDGRLLLRTRIQQLPDGCSMTEVVARDLRTGAEHTLHRLDGLTQPGVSAGPARFSPDGVHALWFTGWEFSEGGQAQLHDLVTDRVHPVVVDRVLSAQLRARMPAPVESDAPCEAFPGPFLADGRLTVALTCNGLGDDFGDVPRWYVVPDDGVVRSDADAITDREEVAELNRRMGCVGLCG